MKNYLIFSIGFYEKKLFDPTAYARRGKRMDHPTCLLDVRTTGLIEVVIVQGVSEFASPGAYHFLGHQRRPQARLCAVPTKYVRILKDKKIKLKTVFDQ